MASGTAKSFGGLRIELLGPVEARVDGRAVALGGQRPRALFAVLALAGGRVVTTDRLIDALWGEEPPARARESLQMHVSRLRKGLADRGADGSRLVSHAGGYLLDLRPGERDVDQWQLALDLARRARADGATRIARNRVEDALGVWHGPPLGGVSTSRVLAAERARLEEERLAAVIDGIELDLELGRHGELLGQLDALVIAHPFKERLIELQMLALYRCGRQADALAAFQAARRRFVDELGIEPSQPLRELHEGVLTHAAGLSSPAGAQPRPAAQRALGRRGLPTPPNRTIGRDTELAVLAERLRTGSVRLLTLTGPGGVGKTRLAVEAARAVETEFADGAYFVALAAAHRPEEVSAAIAGALGVILLAGESAGQAVERFLAPKHLLLVADNFEHVLAAAPFIGSLLDIAPALTVLATSREPLALSAEERYPVRPLSLPGPETPARGDSVTLFAERARAHDPAFDLGDGNAAAVAEICRRVDGLPLAIELAAARCGLLSPVEIAERLDVALGASGAAARDVHARHRSLRATIEWSHQLLGDEEKVCFARFAVFAGGATIEAAQAITGADLDTLDHLVAKSLLVRRRQADTPTRLQMLETLRAYASERFAEAGDRDAVLEHHYRHYLTVAERHGSEQLLFGVGGKERLALLDAEVPNLDAALRWAVSQIDAGAALAMVAALATYWNLRDRHAADALDWIDRALSLPGVEEHPAERARTLLAKAFALRWHGRVAEGPAILDEAQAVARTLDDPLLLARVLRGCSAMWTLADRPDAADLAADEALRCATAADDDWEIAEVWAKKAAVQLSDLSELRERLDRAASLLEDVGNMFILGQLFSDAAYNAINMGFDSDAREFAERAAPLVQHFDNPGGWMYLRGNTGLATLLTGDTEAARDAFREELALCRQLAAVPIACEGLLGLAAVAVVDGDLSRAARLRGAAAAHVYGQLQDLVEARLEAAFFTAARTRHGIDRWDAVVREGRTLSFEDAIAYALVAPTA